MTISIYSYPMDQGSVIPYTHIPYVTETWRLVREKLPDLRVGITIDRSFNITAYNLSTLDEYMPVTSLVYNNELTYPSYFFPFAIRYVIYFS